MHARLQGGALYQYDILDGGKVVGAKSVHIDKTKKPWKETVKMVLGEQEFRTSEEFINAYEKQKLQAIRDQEWEMAAPPPKGEMDD